MAIARAREDTDAVDLAVVKAGWERVQASNPLVMCITNRVTPQRVADLLLAGGASPCMIDNADEVPAFGEISAAIYVNMGLHASQIAANEACSMMYMGKSTQERRTLPALVIDPVGYGATAFRNAAIEEFIEKTRPDAIKGNAAEVAALAGVPLGGKGVDAGSAEASAAIEPAKELARKYGCIVGVTGEFDTITDGVRVLHARGGSAMLTKVTGTGCALGALVAAGISANRDDPLVGAASAHLSFKLAGTLSAAKSTGPGSLAVALPDELYAIAMDPTLLNQAEMTTVECGQSVLDPVHADQAGVTQAN